ncbi:MAG TPA: DUF3097 family protein [Microbacteriaceae bacterium]|nr:DUF3097 family protein [Microbacteriaceae bacterium]
MDDDRYGADVLAGDWRQAGRRQAARVVAAAGLVVEDSLSGYCGAVIRVEGGAVELEDRHGRRRVFPLGGGYLVDGEPVVLTVPGPTLPRRTPATGRAAAGTAMGPAPNAGAGTPRPRTASGSFALAPRPARVARASRIFVEGRHDAELVEKVWGDDLRVEGVVVEYLEGVDNLAEMLRRFRPTPVRRAGVLVDHLVAGSKETRIVADARAQASAGSLLVVGHPFIDVWQAVKPARLGLAAWPHIPHSVEWKHGICQALGWPHAGQADIAAAWRRILATVRDYADLEPAMLGRVEELIDFVTAG